MHGLQCRSSLHQIPHDKHTLMGMLNIERSILQRSHNTGSVKPESAKTLVNSYELWSCSRMGLSRERSEVSMMESSTADGLSVRANVCLNGLEPRVLQSHGCAWSLIGIQAKERSEETS